METLKQQWADVLERGFWTYVQAFLGLVIVSAASDSYLDFTTAQAAALAALPALASFLTGALPQSAGSGFLDVVYRAARTFAVSFLGFIAGMQVFTYESGAWRTALVAAVAAGLSVLKSGIAMRVGNPDSGATLSTALDPTPMAGVPV